jgi:hypothetical protein
MHSRPNRRSFNNPVSTHVISASFCLGPDVMIPARAHMLQFSQAMMVGSSLSALPVRVLLWLVMRMFEAHKVLIPRNAPRR